jgi:peptidyl-prolyl cis-trans isomerase C
MRKRSDDAARRTTCLQVALLLGTALALAIPAGCSRQPKPDPDLVARIGTREIRVAEFQDWMRRRGVNTNAVQKDALLQEMFDHFAAVQEAQHLGLDKDPELRRSWENLLVSKLRERQLEVQSTNAAPTAEQLQTYYRDHLAGYTEPALRRGAVLFAEFPQKTSDERKTQARQRLNEARNKAMASATREPTAPGFGALAVEYSEDPLTRYKGGDIGWVAEGKPDNRFDPAVVRVLFALDQTNQVSEVLDTPRGAYVVKWTDHRPARAKPFEAVEPAIRHKLAIENRQRLETAWKQKLRTHRPTEIFKDVLGRMPAPTGQVLPGTEDPPPVR